MVKDGIRINLSLKPQTMKKLEIEAKKLKKTKTGYIRDLIELKVKRAERESVEKSLKIADKYQNIYAGLNATMSNLNQLLIILHTTDKEKAVTIDIINDFIKEINNIRNHTIEVSKSVKEFKDTIYIFNNTTARKQYQIKKHAKKDKL